MSVVASWRDLIARYEEFKTGQWCFRGDHWRATGFKTSLERAAIDRWGLDWSTLPDVEAGLLRRFKREAHLYLEREPAEQDKIGWLALMRHHGAPTRLHDWTYSFFVALHFALERAEPGDQPCVWALDLDLLRSRVEQRDHLRTQLNHDQNAKDPDTVRAIIDHPDRHPLVFPLNPLRMNRRLVLQQSVFLVPGDITRGFEDNLQAVASRGDLITEIRLSKDRSFLREATRELLAMNISSATLFPGLDGFASQLKELIPFQELRALDTVPGQE